jgi:flagellar motor protein MotB
MSEHEEQASTAPNDLAFVSLILIMLCFFAYLVAHSKPDPMQEHRVLEAIRDHYAGSEGVRRLRAERLSPDQIIQVARQARFEVVQREGKFMLTLPGGELFASADDQIRPEYLPALRRIARIVASLELQARIEGHTDNQPLLGGKFPSNWELSAARAVSVLREFTAQGVPPTRVSAAGRGEYVPRASNDTEYGRGQNRRVTILLEAPR